MENAALENAALGNVGCNDCACDGPVSNGDLFRFSTVSDEKRDLRFRCVPPVAFYNLENSMSEFTFSLEQILESVNEMRVEIRECIEPGSSSTIEEISIDSWKAPEESWFQDCEFDPR